MSKRRKIMATSLLAFLLATSVWRILGTQSATPILSFNAVNSMSRSTPTFSIVVTNASRFSVTLRRPIVQRENREGVTVTYLGEVWEGTEDAPTLLPNESATLSSRTFDGAKKARCVIECSWSASTLSRTLSRGIQKLPIKKLPVGVRVWLQRRGLVDGKCSRKFESVWVDNPSLEPSSDSRTNSDK